ncbi:MAG: tRNA pseudouridine(38-40) synthase TruA [Aeromicrobium sp.]|uniref:tRNA pseudouridine(38-40) synthase TruA n=1 Tax=Aeromicrobium sp. TaxID=1871063 RepID=UPI0039E3F236
MRLRIDLAYDGTEFSGWAAQPGLRTVQGELEQALATVLRLSERPQVVCAGRTDAGVHARGQVAHVDLDTHPGVLERRLRRLVPGDIRVKSVTEAPEGFDARFAAVERRYVYRMTDHPAGPDPMSRRMIVANPRPLTVDLMNEAADHLLGEHDFASFCKKRDGATTIRNLLALRTMRGGETIATTVRADAFCHSMVRALMGCLVAVGERRHPPEFAAEILAAQVRDPRVKVMPAHGLVLEEVVYPPDDQLAARVEQSRRRRDERPLPRLTTP